MENTGCKTCPGIYGSIDIDPAGAACGVPTPGKDLGKPRSRGDVRRGNPRGRDGTPTELKTRIVQPSVMPYTPVNTPAPTQIVSKGNGEDVPVAARRPAPPAAPRMVPRVTVASNVGPVANIAAPLPASPLPASPAKSLVPGSPEYCAQFPETELCRQGKIAPAPATSTATPIYCGDPGAHPELCNPRPVNAVTQPATPGEAIVSKAAPGAASAEAVKASGAVRQTLEGCLVDFLNMTPERQIATIQSSGPLGTYTTSSEAIVGIRAGRQEAARAFADFLRTFSEGSPEIVAFCAEVNLAIAPELNPAGFFTSARQLRERDPFRVIGAPDGTTVVQYGRDGLSLPYGLVVSRGGVAEFWFRTNEPPTVYATAPTGETRTAFGAPNASIQWSQMAPVARTADRRGYYEVGSGDEKKTSRPESYPARVSPITGIEAMPIDGYQKAPSTLKGAGRIEFPGFVVGGSADTVQWDARYSIPSPMMPAGYVGGCMTPAGQVMQNGSRFWQNSGFGQQIPGFSPAGAAVDHDGFLDLFVQLPADAQAAVLTSPAFGQGEIREPYAHFLAGLLRRGETMFNDVPVVDLAVSHIKNFASRAQAPTARALIDVAIRQEATSRGFVAPANNGFAPAGDPAPQANQPPPGFTSAQWGELLRTNPEVAQRMWTEYQQRPSTFSQVSGTILQGANLVLSQLNASRASSLEERRADYAHQQAMARIRIDSENAAAQRLANQSQPQMTMTAPLTVQQPAPPPAPPAAPPPADQSAGRLSTSAMAAIGIGVVALGGGGIYLATRRGGSRSARSNGYFGKLFGGKSKSGKKGR